MKYYIKNRKMLRVFLIGWMIIILYSMYLAVIGTLDNSNYVLLGALSIGFFLILWIGSYFFKRVYMDYPMLEITDEAMIVRTQPRNIVVIRYEDMDTFELRSVYMNSNGFVKMKSGVEFPVPLMNIDCNPTEILELVNANIKKRSDI